MPKRMLSEAEGYDLLRTYGIPVPDYKIVQSMDDVMKAANKIGYPVVMKIVSPQVVHKSDVGGVIIGIRTESEVEKAFNDEGVDVGMDTETAVSNDYKQGDNKFTGKIVNVTIDTKPSNLSTADQKSVEDAEEVDAAIED